MASPSRSSPRTRRMTTDAGRWYEVPTEDGTSRYPSVTTILNAINKPALLNWMARTERELVSRKAYELYSDIHTTPKLGREAWSNTLKGRIGKAKAGERLLRKASNIGTETHGLIEWTLRKELGEEAGPEPALTSGAAKQAFSAWQDWRAQVHLVPRHIEQTVWSSKHGYAGTLDLLAEVDGVPGVIDWKTGKAVYPESHLQIVAYAAALTEMGHAEHLACYIVRLPKQASDPGFEYVEVEREMHGELLAPDGERIDAPATDDTGAPRGACPGHPGGEGYGHGRPPAE